MMVVIDADPIVYRCGFASERTSWHLVYENSPPGPVEVEEVEFSPDDDFTAGERMRDWLALNPQVTILDSRCHSGPD